ncbi:MAG: hypothetical protein HAW62_00015 [Endozoicomonadaceae bacterium]|nr:hypothetical protein [Endozoicomonadaceae bacterium]
MKPEKKIKEKDTQTRQTNLFQNKLSNLLDHELIQLSEIIPWAVFEETFGVYYSETRDRPRKSIRLMVSLLRLHHIHDLSDEKTVKAWK